MADVEIIETADGSETGRHLESGATYRSVFGALQEVRHVFLDSTGIAGGDGKWSVVELGFGLGTSFAETCRTAHEHGLELHYQSVERDPAPPEAARHPEERYRTLAARALDELARSQSVRIEEEGVTLQVERTEWVDASFAAGAADAVHFDPFGPTVNPEAWTEEAFRKAHALLSPTGRLATYSAAGHVRRAMAQAGLFLATRPGPGRKREITVASPTDAGLGDLERLSMSRYLKRPEDA